MVTFPGCRVVLITGASSGIGRECAARTPVGRGAPVAEGVRRRVTSADAGRPTTRSVPRFGGLVRLARPAAVGALLDVVFGRFGRAIAGRVRGLERDQSEGVPAR